VTRKPELDTIAEELKTLGGLLPDPVAGSGLAVAVLARVADLPAPPRPRAVVRHRRRMAIAALALLLSLLAAPPVRAAIADWFSFAGVVVHHDPSPAPHSAPPPPTLRSTTDLRTAKTLVAFDPLVPAELGQPEAVEVSSDHRIVSMSWISQNDGPLHLDQFDARLDYAFAKRAAGVEFTSVAGSSAIWFNAPHSVVVLNRNGTSHTETARLAGHTLIWEHEGTTLRLEGDISLERAVEIAASAKPSP
jgi:hypothetical protein